MLCHLLQLNVKFTFL